MYEINADVHDDSNQMVESNLGLHYESAHDAVVSRPFRDPDAPYAR